MILLFLFNSFFFFFLLFFKIFMLTNANVFVLLAYYSSFSSKSVSDSPLQLIAIMVPVCVCVGCCCIALFWFHPLYLVIQRSHQNNGFKTVFKTHIKFMAFALARALSFSPLFPFNLLSWFIIFFELRFLCFFFLFFCLISTLIFIATNDRLKLRPCMYLFPRTLLSFEFCP